MALMSRTGPRTALGAESEAHSLRTRSWVAVSILIVALGLAALATVRVLERGPQPPDTRLDAAAVLPPAPRSDGVIRLAGTGSALPIARRLADAYVSTHPEVKIHVHESIGSTGGVRALIDGAIDVALISRPLTRDEAAAGLRSSPYALDAVVFAGHPSVPVAGISSVEAVEIFAGRQPNWPDGSRVVVLQRERGDGGHEVAREAIVGFAAADDAGRRAGLWHVLFSDESIQQTLINAPGSIALMDLGTAVAQSLPLKVLALDGVQPDDDTVKDGSYPLVIELAFVVRTRSALGPVQDFLGFVYSDEGARIIDDSGYITVDPGLNE